MTFLHFNEKIECIYKYIANSDINKLTKLFYVKGAKASFENRKSYIRKKWLKKQNSNLTPRTFKRDYFKYPFSKLDINGKRVFNDANEFLELPLENFCKRIKDYKESIVQDIDNKYIFRYLYIYDKGINILEIKYIQNMGYSEYYIEATYLDKTYSGSLKLQPDKIIITLQDNTGYFNALFNLKLVDNNFLVGIANFINTSYKYPIAKKVILAKQSITDLTLINLVLNTTETFEAKESLYIINNTLEKKLYSNSIKKISKISNFLNNKLVTKNLDLYNLLSLKELEATSKLLKKTLHNNSYFVNYKKRVIEQVIKSFQYKKYESLFMVYPLIQKDYIFSDISSGSMLLKQKLLELSQKVNIEIIFIISKCNQELKKEFLNFLSNIDNISIYFAIFKDIEQEVDSIDFIFSSNKDFIVTKNLRGSLDRYNVFTDYHNIKEYETMFLKIKNLSIKYKLDNNLCKEVEKSNRPKEKLAI